MLIFLDLSIFFINFMCEEVHMEFLFSLGPHPASRIVPHHFHISETQEGEGWNSTSPYCCYVTTSC